MGSEKYQLLSFGEFTLDARRRRFLRLEEPVILNAKAFDLLLFLVENSGRVISKQEIIDAVWKDQFVEESNLTVQISALRTALGEKASSPRFLVTIPGTGYQFVAEVKISEFSSSPEQPIEEDQISKLSDSEFTPPNVIPEKRSFVRRQIFPIIALASVLIVSAVLIGRSYYAGPEPVHSIAVLPFSERNSNSPSDYLGDGLAESVIFSLSRIRDLKVMSRDSAFRYRDETVDAKKIGRELGVGSILTGRISRTSDSVLVRAELVSASDNTVIWGEQFSRKLDDIEKLQVDIAQSIALQLRVQMDINDARLIEKNQTGDNEAFQHYLAGRFHLKKLTDDGFVKARESFKEAISKDPNYALAHAGMAEAYNLLSGWGAIAPNDGFPLAKAAAMRALEIDDNLAEAHTQMGIVTLFYDLDLKGAEREFIRAIEINPSFSDAHYMFTYALIAQGRFETAESSAVRSRELDPLSIAKLITLGDVFLYSRKPDEAAVHYNEALVMDPNSGFARWALGNAYMQSKRFPEAVEEFELAVRLSGSSPDEPAGLAVAKILSGNSHEARAILSDLMERSKKSHVSPALIAIIHGHLGENDKAFEFLERAVRERDSILLLIKFDPYFDPLRSDPRFAELQKRLGLQ